MCLLLLNPPREPEHPIADLETLNLWTHSGDNSVENVEDQSPIPAFYEIEIRI